MPEELKSLMSSYVIFFTLCYITSLGPSILLEFCSQALSILILPSELADYLLMLSLSTANDTGVD
jgi:hypothetical protein